jgi:hypothetical protein
MQKELKMHKKFEQGSVVQLTNNLKESIKNNSFLLSDYRKLAKSSNDKFLVRGTYLFQGHTYLYLKDIHGKSFSSTLFIEYDPERICKNA